MHKKSDLVHFFIGGVLIFLGLVFFLENTDMIHFPFQYYIFSWPSIFLFIGIIMLLKSTNKGFGFILLSIGVLGMLTRIFPSLYLGDMIIPLILLAIGLLIIFKRHSKFGGPGKFKDHRNMRTGSTSKDKIEEVNIFGGGAKTITSENFMGGDVCAFFGGSELDLTRSKMAPGDNVLDIVALFGGVELYIPQNWNVKVEVFSLFGGFSDKRRLEPDSIEDLESTLIIQGVVIFGGGEIKSFRTRD